jgi:hypothetical protein
MPLVPPSQSSDIFDIAQRFTGVNPQPANGFAAATVPSQSGLGTRTGRLPVQRTGSFGRKLIHWLVPEGPMVQMYINPNNIRIDHSKNITNQRTKGGFVIQYWGENLIPLSISGTTGTSGIEGINVLLDVYRNEQLAFDPFALFMAARQKQEAFAGDVFGVGSALFEASSAEDVGDAFLDGLTGAASEAFPQAATQAPTLASLAAQVEMYWSGEVYRGYFESFSVIERADNLGMFDYEIKFTATQKRGFRRNFLGWHRSPVYGPSNSDPSLGPPHSFGNLMEGDITPSRRQAQPDVLDEFEFLANNLFG